jgi:hypothetical protein
MGIGLLHLQPIVPRSIKVVFVQTQFLQKLGFVMTPISNPIFRTPDQVYYFTQDLMSLGRGLEHRKTQAWFVGVLGTGFSSISKFQNFEFKISNWNSYYYNKYVF